MPIKTERAETERAVAAILVSQSLYFVAKHSSDSPSGSKWTFPGGPLSAGASARQALQQHLKDKLNLNATVGEHVGTFTGGTEVMPVEVECYRIERFSGELALSSYAACGWLNDASMQVLQFAQPHDAIWRAIQQ